MWCCRSSSDRSQVRATGIRPARCETRVSSRAVAFMTSSAARDVPLAMAKSESGSERKYASNGTAWALFLRPQPRDFGLCQGWSPVGGMS